MGGLLCYFHWEAMLISYLAQRVVKIPFYNMQEFYDSDYILATTPGSSFWNAFENGNQLWKKIHKDKLQPIIKAKQMEYLLGDEENALYGNINTFL